MERNNRNKDLTRSEVGGDNSPEKLGRFNMPVSPKVSSHHNFES